MKLFILLKFVFSATLLILFISFFGLPSLDKFRAEEVMVNRKIISTNNIPTPAISICALQTNEEKSITGWRKDFVEKQDTGITEIDLKLELKSELIRNCNESNNENKIVNCVNMKTFNISETVPESFSRDDSINFPNSYWIDEVSVFTFGKCHTLNNSVSLGASTWNFLLDNNLNYKIWIHDPQYFLLTANPATIPAAFMDLKANEGFQMIYIEVIEHLNIDRPLRPCKDQNNYSFTTCVKESVSEKIGCR